MADQILRFESLLANVRSAELKRMAQRWGGSYQSRKEECLDRILTGLRDPEQVRDVVARLPDLDRVALGLVRWAGGSIEAKALATGLRASGVDLPKERNSRGDHQLIRRLIESGTVLSTYSSDPTYVPEYGGTTLIADERLLAVVEPPSFTPFTLPLTTLPPIVRVRRPATVGMDLAALFRAIETLGGLQLTKAGDVRAGDLRKLGRSLKWPEDALITDGLIFLQPIAALCAAIAASGGLRHQADRLVVDDYESLISRPYAEQVDDLVHGFLSLSKWREEGDEQEFRTYETRYPAMRLALVVALAALPNIPGAFFAIDELSAAIFARVGKHFSLSYGPHPLYVYNKTPDEVRKAEEEWYAKLRADWSKLERPWIDRALTGWIFFLGLVELGFADNKPISVRLTDLGHAILREESVGAEASPPASGVVWVIQPNFELVVYLDHASPAQVAFVERHAERIQAQSHVASYRLTRDTVHRGLESGTSPEQLLETLQVGAGVDIPQNVLATLREWAAQRERITLRRSVSVLEFPEEALREAAIQHGLDGRSIGERFVLVSQTRQALPHIHVDYARPLPQCLTVTEDGQMKLARATPDLLIQAQIDHWAERIDASTWRLTTTSVVAGIKAGSPIEKLLALLRERLIHPLPSLLEVALRAWAGKAPSVALQTVTALRCTQREVFTALAGSELLAPYLRGVLAPDVLLVDTDQLAALRECLAWAGLSISDMLEVI
jgi:hypothetical protein